MTFKRRRISEELRMSTLMPASTPKDVRQVQLEALLDGGLPYSEKLRGHTACVNALALSQSGRWLASGGDDPNILLWDFHQENLSEPVRRFVGHRTNIFALAFSATTRFIYSGATDNTIHRYDFEYARTSIDSHAVTDPDTMHLLHKDIIRGLSCHPQHDEIFLSASDDGCIILHDMRAESTLTRAQGTLQHESEFTSVQFHPEMSHIILTSDSYGDVCLRDSRMAFGPKSTRQSKGVVQKYVTTVTKPSIGHCANPEVSSVTFDSTGQKLAATMTHFFPTIYSISDPYPVAVCMGAAPSSSFSVPSDERTYANSCTIKHGSFGGGGLADDPYYCAGSDDFGAYIWKIPSLATLAQQRTEVSIDDWLDEDPNTIGFAESSVGPRHIPVTLSQPTTRLNGHQSIVNTALMHPTFPAVLTAGIERNIILHSPTPATPFLPSAFLSPTPTEVRALPLPPDHSRFSERALAFVLPGEGEPEDDESSIALFDHILRQESGVDVFHARKCDGGDHEHEDTDDELEAIVEN